MNFFEEKIKIEEINTLKMYQMIYQLLKTSYFYEAKCLVSTFIEERTSEEELKTLNKIQSLLYKYMYIDLKTDKTIYLNKAMTLLENNINKLEIKNKKKSIMNRIIDKLF